MNKESITIILEEIEQKVTIQSWIKYNRILII